ncbi:MAG: NTP transferase domain-containing protein [Polyangiaceae bacterium]|nr:NTP transferase domain-containing protein [Polyangiaceae bacterium]
MTPKKPERTAVVLAAGLGSRLQGVSSGPTLKPLTVVAGVPLVSRTVRSLELAGCSRIVMVLGHEAQALQRAVESTVTASVPVAFVLNERYRLANGVSVLAAREQAGDEFLLTMSDHVFGDEVMLAVAERAPPVGGAALAVDYKLERIFDMDDATKVKAEGGRILAIGKQLTDYNCVDTGLFFCTSALMDALENVVERSGDASLSQGVALLAEQGKMAAINVGDGFWQDVDTPAMLEHAERMLAERESTSRKPPAAL